MCCFHLGILSPRVQLCSIGESRIIAAPGVRWRSAPMSSSTWLGLGLGLGSGSGLGSVVRVGVWVEVWARVGVRG